MPPLPDQPSLSRSSSSSGASYLVDMGSVRLDHDSQPRTLRDTVRPHDPLDIKKAWHAHFASATSIEELRHRAINKGGLSLDYGTLQSGQRKVDDLSASQGVAGRRTRGAAGEDEQGPLMRSVYWRIYLGTLPYPFSSANTLASNLASSRSRYDSLRRKHLVAPDGRWAADCTVPENDDGRLTSEEASRRGSGAPSNGLGVTKGKEAAWDPLDLEEHNPWQSWFQHEELRKTILKDIERTFPDIPYFIDPAVRKIMMTVLFLWSAENEEIGYRQGMHELLGVLLMVCDRDAYFSTNVSQPTQVSYNPLDHTRSASVKQDSNYDPVLPVVLDAKKVEHDCWNLFEKVMERCRGWYEWRGTGAQSQPSAAKIVGLCNHLQGQALRKVDPVLHKKLEVEGIEGQLWGIRYIRLLFTREMPLLSAMRLWDGLFAEDPELTELVEAVCLAMLLRIRSLLISGDYATILTHLLRYPADSPEMPLVPDMLLHQALSLRQSPSPATGANIALQNQEVLGIAPVSVLEDEPVYISNPGRVSRGGEGKAHPPSSPRGVLAKGGGTRFDTLARGLMERAQASGLDKTLYSAVTEIRKNLPEFPASPSTSFPFRTFSPPTEDNDFSHIPSFQQALPQPPPRTLRDADLEIAELRLSLINMGKSMDKWLRVVRKGVDASGAAAGEELTSEQAVQAAWTGMDKLRDALLNAAITPATDMAREWAWSLGEPEPGKAEAFMQLTQHQPQAGAILGQARSGHVRNLSNGVNPSTNQARSTGSHPHSRSSPVHPPLPLESRLAGMVQGTSPRQFSFPSPFAGTSTASKPDWSKQRAQAVPIPPPIRQSRPPVTSTGDEVLFDRPNTPDSAQTSVPKSYPPIRALEEDEPVNIDPLLGLPATSDVARTRVVHPVREPIIDPLSGTVMEAHIPSQEPPSSRARTLTRPSSKKSGGVPMKPLLIDLHVKYIQALDTKKQDLAYHLSEHLRINGVYWGITALCLMNRQDALDRTEMINYVMSCWDDEAGAFGTHPRHDAHLLGTMSAIQILAIQDSLHLVNQDRLIPYILSVIDPLTGAVSGDTWKNEHDTRFLYIAVACLSMLGRLSVIDAAPHRSMGGNLASTSPKTWRELLVEQLERCKNFDGGFGSREGSESHGGQCGCDPSSRSVSPGFVCVAALAILDRLDLVDRPTLCWWLCERQLASGGLNGRPEKLEDVCYSWWNLSALSILGKMNWIDKDRLMAFILDAQDEENGGIADRAGDWVDVFHTYFGLAGLSMLGYPGLADLDPIYCMPTSVVERLGLMKEYHNLPRLQAV